MAIPTMVQGAMKTKSNKGPLKHGMYKTRIYTIWAKMKHRCLNKNAPNYKFYGGRGITICKRWIKFSNFYSDVKNIYKNGLFLDRIDNNGNYEPGNVRFVTSAVNCNNRRTNLYVKIGSNSKSVSDWCRIFGVNPSTAHSRIDRGWNHAVSVILKATNQRHINQGE